MKRIVSLMVVLAMVLTAFTGWSLVAAADNFVVTFDTAMDLGGIPGSVVPIEKTFSYAKGESKIAGGWIGGVFDAASTLVYTVDNGADNVINMSDPGQPVIDAVKGMYKDATFITRFTADFTQTLSDTFHGASQTIRMYVKKPDGGKVLFATFVTDTNKQVSLEKTSFYEGDPIVVTYKNADKTDNNWVCIYKDPVGEQKYGDTDYTSQQYAYVDGSGKIVFNDPEKKVAENDRTAVLTGADDGSQNIIVYNQGAIETLAPGNYHVLILGKGDGSEWYAVKSDKISFEVVARKPITGDDGDYTVDLAKLANMKPAGTYAAHGYPDLVSQLLGYDNHLPIGLFDLTNFDSVEITYATDANFKAKYPEMSVTSCFALMSKDVSVGYATLPDYQYKESIIAMGNCADASVLNPDAGGWAQNERKAIIDVSNLNYTGQITLSHFNSLGNETLLVGIKFIAKKAPAAEKTISTNKTVYAVGEPIKVTYNGAVAGNNDWLCIYKDPVGEQKYGDTDYTSQQYAYIDGDGMIVFNDPNNKVEGNDRTAVVTAGDDGSQTIIVYNQGAIGTLEPGNYHAIILGGSGWYAIESEKVSFTVVDGPIHVTSVEEMKQAGNYKLDTDIAGDLIISEGEYTIDLNGCIWDGSLSIKGGNVTINDSAEEKGAITSSTSDVIELPDGSTAVVTLNEIAVLGNKSECDGVFVRAGKVTINNCLISALSSAVQNRTAAGEITINGGVYMSQYNALKVRDGATIAINGETMCIGELLIHNNDRPFEEAFIVNSNLYGRSVTIEDPDLGTVNATVFYVIGDVNGDGTVDGADITLLLQDLAEWNVEIDELRADVNCDGEINGKDATLLQQYHAEWDVELGPQSAA
ncbi:MAG: dockerin type I repeat-containing protein [Clostridia bacterium]